MRPPQSASTPDRSYPGSDLTRRSLRSIPDANGHARCQNCARHSFCAFSQGDVPALTTRRYRAGEFIIHQGDARPHLLLLCQGLCLITSLTEDGEEVVLHACGSTGILDLSGWLAGSMASSISARALVDSVVATIPSQELETWVRGDSTWTRALLRHIGWQMRMVEERLRWQSARDASARIMHGLLELLGILGVRAEKDVILPRSVSQAVLAQFLGLRRETLSRTLARMHRLRILKYQKGRITFPNPSQIALAMRRKFPTP
ncbi:MAG: Crp/Fnr family transcriptional regulator [Gaiellales bacterium]|nr:MAG: Crp/Fnr family transcriptional regulator [Gaiellales bacterium]